MPEADDAKNQFLEAISVMSPGFYETWVLRLQDKGDIPFADIINRYRAHWKITYGKAGGQRGVSKAAFSTWQGYEEAKPIESKPTESKIEDLENKPCLCGKTKPRYHMLWFCWEIYEDKRPPGF